MNEIKKNAPRKKQKFQTSVLLTIFTISHLYSFIFGIFFHNLSIPSLLFFESYVGHPVLVNALDDFGDHDEFMEFNFHSASLDILNVIN